MCSASSASVWKIRKFVVSRTSQLPTVAGARWASREVAGVGALGTAAGAASVRGLGNRRAG